MIQITEILIITIVAELIAVALITVIGAVFSQKARWVLTAVFGRLLDIDIEHVFRNKHEANADIQLELSRASFSYFLTGRGNELQRETFAGMLSGGRKGRQHNCRILLPVAESKPNEPNWTEQREQEMAAVDSAFGTGILRSQIETTAKFLIPYLSAGNVTLKRFSYPHIGRILITDRVAYFSPYRDDAHGRDSRVIKYRRGGEMYDFLLRLFNQLWKVG